MNVCEMVGYRPVRSASRIYVDDACTRRTLLLPGSCRQAVVMLGASAEVPRLTTMGGTSGVNHSSMTTSTRRR
jgi:hypothetical protein